MPKTTPAEGDHNLTADDEEALFIHHLSKLREQGALVARAKSTYDATREAQTVLFRTAKADGFLRKELQAILDCDSKVSQRELERAEERRSKLRVWAGLPVGAQGELFAGVPEELKDDAYYRGAGYAAGLRGEEADAPEGTPPRFVPTWMTGRMEGQEKLAWGLAAAGRLVDRRPDADSRPVQLDPEPDDEPALDIDAEARKLKKGAFGKKSAAAEPALADA